MTDKEKVDKDYVNVDKKVDPETGEVLPEELQ